MLADPGTAVRKGASHGRLSQRLAAGAESLEDLVVFGEAALLELGEDELAIDDHVEDAALAAHELGVDASLALDGGR